ncbi:MAG: phospholipid carrier-dependent glycosyltransferase [Chloroflexota bacterium]
MQNRPIPREPLYYTLAFLLALGLRLIGLGKLPLTDFEAGWALQSLGVVQGADPALGPNPAYVLLTSILFYIFGASNFLARFWPALAGSLLVFVPYFFRHRLGPTAALILAFCLAVDPGLVAASRMAGGPILAVLFLLLAWAAWSQARPQWAGVFAALTLLSGPAAWAGLLGLVLAWMIRQGLERPPSTESSTGTFPTSPGEPTKPETPPQKTETWKPAILPFLATLLLGGSLLFLVPGGLGAWAGALPAYLKGWITPSGVPAGRLLFALVVYQPLAILFGVVALLLGWWQGRRRAIRLGLWFVIALFLALAHPARQAIDLAWALIPLWALAAEELSRHLDFPQEDRLELIGVFSFTVLLLVFAWLDLAGLVWTGLPSQQGSVRIWLFIGSLVLLVVSLFLVAFGWSRPIARLGGVWGAAVVLAFYTLGVAWGATGLRTPGGVELWTNDRAVAQADLLALTADQISEWSTGHTDDLPVTVQIADSPSVLWALRNHAPRLATTLDPASAPPLVVTPALDNPGLAAAYRGQDFVWRQTPLWDALLPTDWLRWYFFRDMPVESETIVLWARDDLFLDAR